MVSHGDMKRDFEAARADLTPHLLLARPCSACGASTDEPCTPAPRDTDNSRNHAETDITAFRTHESRIGRHRG